ncbi:hypothetical protein Tco_1210202 [Tanacetum coccineum]
MGTIDDMKSSLTQSALDALCEKFHIPRTVHTELPGRNQRIRNTPTGKIGVYTSCLLLRPLRSLISRSYAAFMVLFRLFFWVDSSAFPLSIPWHNNKTQKKDPHPTPTEFNAEVCDFLAAHLASFRKFLESFLCLVGIIRYYELDDNVYPDFLADDDGGGDGFVCLTMRIPPRYGYARSKLRKDKFRCLSLLGAMWFRLLVLMNKETKMIMFRMLLMLFKMRELTLFLMRRLRQLLLISPKFKKRGEDPPKKLREDHGISRDVGANTGGMSLVVIQEVFERSALNVEVSVTVAATMPFVTSSVTLSPECKGGGHTDSVSRPNLQTKHPTERFVISLDFSHHSSTNTADDEVTSIVRSPMPPPLVMIAAIATTAIVSATSALIHESGTGPVQRSIFRDSASPSTTEADVVGPFQPAGVEVSTDTFYISQKMDSETLQQTYVPKWNVINDSALDDPDVCRSMVDQLAPPSAELSLKEFEAAKAIRLHNQVAAIEATEAAQDLSNFQLSCDELSIKAASLESEKDKLIDQVSLLEITYFSLCDQVLGYELFKKHIKVVQDEQLKFLSDKVAGLDAELIGMALHLDEEFYPRFLTTIAGRKGLVDVAAYNPSAEANYVSAVNALRTVDFPLLSQLESQKDASIADIMGLLHLEVHARNQRIRGDVASQRLSIYDTMVPLIEPLSAKNLVGEASLSGVPAAVATTTALSATFVQASSIPPVPALDYEVVDTEPQAEASSSPKIIFDQETLETSSEHPATYLSLLLTLVLPACRNILSYVVVSTMTVCGPFVAVVCT